MVGFLANPTGSRLFDPLNVRGMIDPSKRAIPTPAPAVKPPGLTDPLSRLPSDEQDAALAAAEGRGSTILTGGLGDTSTATTQKKTLLGG